ncbi:NUDIX domain-containing protein [Polynucleobacter necessarius]|uniref:NUDIX domain-containing protein n=1 Tax=Polynucleobacter necessarius TaxID=576610 RepID=UPI001575C9F4
MNKDARPVTEVAAGILLDQSGRFLLGQRPEGKPYAGYWEVPGGKIEKGETVFDALKRELQEELGIKIQSSEELMLLEHDYPHAYVRLHVSLIRDWKGDPKGCEGQALSWEFPVQKSLVSNRCYQPHGQCWRGLKPFYPRTGRGLI